MENEEFKTENNTQETPLSDSVDEKIVEKKEGVVGPIIGSIIVIILIVIGGIYYWNSIVNKEIKTGEETPNVQDESLNEIEASLEADFSELDNELDQIEAEFNAESGI